MSKSCPKCGGRLEQGILLELKDGNQKAVTEWVEGMPEKKHPAGVWWTAVAGRK